MNFIGDVHGRFDLLQKLLLKVPDEPFLCLGDLNDRGPQSKEVIDFVMKNGDSLASNHGQMFFKYIARANFETTLWLHENNGGKETLKSYGYDWTKDDEPEILLKHAEWLTTRPAVYAEEGVIATHAPIEGSISVKELVRTKDNIHYYLKESLLWSKVLPWEDSEYFQIHGHCWNHCQYVNIITGRWWGICIDDMANNRLMGINWPSKEIYYVE